MSKKRYYDKDGYSTAADFPVLVYKENVQHAYLHSCHRAAHKRPTYFSKDPNPTVLDDFNDLP